MEKAEKERKEKLSFRFVPTRRVIENYKKIVKKLKKLKKIAFWRLFKPKEDEKGREREKIKIIVPFHSYPTCNRKFQKNCKRIQKNKKIPLRLHFTPKYVGND